jgi:hypothetical protein
VLSCVYGAGDVGVSLGYEDDDLRRNIPPQFEAVEDDELNVEDEEHEVVEL